MATKMTPQKISRDFHHPSGQSIELEQVAGLEDTTLDPAHPRPWHAPVTAFSSRLWRQLLGLNPFKGSYFGLFGSLEGRRDRTVAFIGGVCAVAAGIPLPIIGVIFGEIISSFPPDEEELRIRITQLLGVAVAYFAVTSVYTICFGLTGDRIAIRLRERLLRSLLHLDQAYLDIQDIDVSALLSQNMDTIQVGCSEKVGIFLQSMSYFFAAFTVGFILNAKLTGILLAAVIPTMTIIVSTGSTAISKLTRQISEHTEQGNAVVESALRAVKIVQAFEMMDQMCQAQSQHLTKSTKAGFHKAVVSALELGGAYFTAYAANALAFFVGSRMAASGASGGDAGTIYAVVFLILDASFVVGQFAPFLEIFARAASAYGAVQEILEACREHESKARLMEKARDIDIRGKDLHFSNVCFSYPARPTVKALNDLDLVVQAGKLTAVVGTSGGGKSTLLALLLRLYEHSGSIHAGTQDIRNVNPHQVRAQIAVLDQDCALFSGTIFENICHGIKDPNISSSHREAFCQQAIQDAGVDFLEDLPNGLHTRIDNTLQLSGGQRQRICLARALIRKPAVLVLDEPTSALDAQSEIKVLQAVKKAMDRGTTVLMIAHRLSTVLDADCVAVVSEGRVVEEGQPLELSRGDTVFRALLDAQNTNVEKDTSTLDSIMYSSENSQASCEKAHSLPEDRETRASSAQMTFLELITAIARFTRPERTFLLIGVLASVLSGSIIVGEAIVFGALVELLNTSVSSPGFQGEANFYCLMFFVLALVALVSYIASGSAFGVASNRLTNRVQSALLKHVLHLDIEWFSGPGRSTPELSSSFSKDSGDLACLSGVALGTISTVIISVLGGIVLAHVVAWKISIVLLVAVPIMIASGFIRLRMLATAELHHRTKYNEATALAIEACRNRKTVTILGVENVILEQFQDDLQKPQKRGLVFTLLCNTLLAFSLAITYFVYALAYWWGAKQVRTGLYSQKEFFTVLPALLFSAQAAGQLFSLSPEIARAKTAAMNVFTTLAFKAKFLGDNDGSNRDAAQLMVEQSVQRKDEKGSILEFDDVSFSYSGNTQQSALQGVSFSIANGDTVAVVGPSGAGKSSTLGLIERFHDPSMGRVLYQNADISTIDVQHLRRHLAIVPQEPELFTGSIGYNIRLGAGERSAQVTQEQIETVGKQCCLHEFVSSLPSGYNTECGSVGNAQLSGGQRQRLSLARALIRNPDVLLLDEPTSALDAQSEQHVQEALKAASKGRTTVIVAHRLATILHVDKILVFDQGKIVEQGTHTELVQCGGIYAAMAKAQALC